MNPGNRVLPDYILHCGNTGEGEGVALIWLEAECPLTDKGRVSLTGQQGRDILITEADGQITLPGADEACLAVIRATRALHVIYQAPEGLTQSVKLALIQ